MITAKHKKIWELFFILYAKINLKRIYREIRLYHVKDRYDSACIETDKPIILISNHFSFWDGFIHLLLNRSLFNKRVYIMMLYKQLSIRRFLRYGGCFSVEPGKKSVFETLRYCSSILKNSSNLLLIFPQGEIESLYVDDYSFRSGVERIASEANSADIYFNINLINFFSNKRPTMTIYYKKYNPQGEGDETLESAYNKFASECRSLESKEVKGVKIL